jgi:hypothetical protein
MPDRAVELLLAACRECGALQLRDLYVEVALIADGKAFTTAELCAHAELPENWRLREALVAVCGADFAAGKVGKILAKWKGRELAGIVVDAIGTEANAILWTCQSQPKPAEDSEAANIVAIPFIRKRHV